MKYDEDREDKINELSEIIRYTFKKNKQGSRAKYIKKQEFIEIRKLIGFIGMYAWVGVNYTFPAFKQAGFKSNKIYKKYDIIKTVLYFNLLWIQRLPKVLCHMITSFIPNEPKDYYLF